MRRRTVVTGGVALLALAATGAGLGGPAFAEAPKDPRGLLEDYADWREAQETRATHLPALEDAAFAATNARREEAGLAALEPEDGLRRVARHYAARMAGGAPFAHTDPAGRGPGDRVSILHRRFVGIVGENIFKSDIFTGSAQGRAGRFAVDSLMESPGHRENILSRQWTHAAIGAVADGEMFHLVQLFGLRGALLAEDAPLEVRAGSPLPPAFTRFVAGGADRLAVTAPDAPVNGADFRPLREAVAPRATGVAVSRYARRRSVDGNRVEFDVLPGPAVIVV